MTSPPAAYATRPSGAPNELGQLEAVAKLLGKPLMPWQREVAAVATERAGDRWRYRTVVLTVPRQSGKTTLLGALAVQRLLTRDGLRAWITAQTGKDARARWLELVEAAQASPLGSVTDVTLGAGASRLRVGPTGSFLAPFSPGPKSLHGYTTDLVLVDEAFAFDAAQGADLMGAILPTQQTRPDAQLWIVSTAGGPTSTFLKQWVDNGRASIDDPESRIAYFEWSCPPDRDPLDPATWPTFHPALGHTTTADELGDALAAMSETPHEFRRAYGNQWTTTSSAPIINPADWDAQHEPAMIAPAAGTPVAIVFDVEPDARAAAIVTAWTNPADGLPRTRTVHTMPGTQWIPAALDELTELLGRDSYVVADDAGPNRSTIATLEAAGTPVRILSSKQFGTACQDLAARVADRRVWHDGAPHTRAALMHAVARTTDDGGWKISRKHSTGPVAALNATAVAVHAVASTATYSAPVIYS